MLPIVIVWLNAVSAMSEHNEDYSFSHFRYLFKYLINDIYGHSQNVAFGFLSLKHPLRQDKIIMSN